MLVNFSYKIYNKSDNNCMEYIREYNEYFTDASILDRYPDYLNLSGDELRDIIKSLIINNVPEDYNIRRYVDNLYVTKDSRLPIAYVFLNDIILEDGIYYSAFDVAVRMSDKERPKEFMYYNLNIFVYEGNEENPVFDPHSEKNGYNGFAEIYEFNSENSDSNVMVEVGDKTFGELIDAMEEAYEYVLNDVNRVIAEVETHRRDG